MSGATAVAEAPAGGAGAGEAHEERQQNPIQKLASMVLRMGVMYAFMMYMKGGKQDGGGLDQQGA